MRSSLQTKMVDVILHGYFGDKSKDGGDILRTNEGRVNNFIVLYAWGICAIMDPANVLNWKERITKPLDTLLQWGYLKTAYNDMKANYMSDILGMGDASSEEEEEEEECENVTDVR